MGTYDSAFFRETKVQLYMYINYFQESCPRLNRADVADCWCIHWLWWQATKENTVARSHCDSFSCLAATNTPEIVCYCSHWGVLNNSDQKESSSLRLGPESRRNQLSTVCCCCCVGKTCCLGMLGRGALFGRHLGSWGRWTGEWSQVTASRYDLGSPNYMQRMYVHIVTQGLLGVLQVDNAGRLRLLGIFLNLWEYHVV